MILLLLLVPFLLQALVMLVDEGVHHRRRRLPRWERVGHPLDTLTVAGCYAWLVLAGPTRSNLAVYVGLVAFSCLFVTKDEPLHATQCSAAEHWTHAVLFMLHPIVLIFAGYLWWTAQLPMLITAQLLLTSTFATYQALYWNRPWRRIPTRIPTRTRTRTRMRPAT